MSVRKICAALGVTAVVTSGLALAATAPASADPASTPAADAYVGVGSDTTQFVMTDLINGATVNGTPVAGYNAGVTSGNPLMASFDACTVPVGAMFPCTPGTADSSTFITLRAGTAPVQRPNGSGDGKKRLYGSSDNPDVTFARSSGGLNDAEVTAQLKAYPFAVDTLVMVTGPHSNAPATLTPQQVLGIYNGTITNWSAVGGTAGEINALKPQSGSGTLSFFQTQLNTINGGTAVSMQGKDIELADTTTHQPCATESSTCVKTKVQEHDPTLITNDPNAIAPFSLGRANLAGVDSVKVVKGWSARRALFNVLRSKDAGNSGKTDNSAWFAGTPAMDAIFGKSGFLCSEAARPLIENAGFKQLLSFNDGGSCGAQVSTTAAPDLSVYDADGVNPIVSATASGTKYGAAHSIAVTVSGAGGTPTGDVKVNLGSWTGTGTLSAGKATITAPATLAAGKYDAAVTYLGDDNFTDASTDVPLTVAKAKSAVTEGFAAKIAKKAKKVAGTVKVTISGSKIKGTGPVTVSLGKKILARGTAKAGSVKLSLSAKQLKKGKNKLVVKYAGNSNVAASSKSFTITKK
ncbi:substrate-binding domain-containing protein [Nocardioides conyzicola]|uniref:PBP domain-containing protein n=1 Tax=Nocardioides conyzicola TaxID=1651781 RepID=A0ABP8XPA6_9ACTN